MKSPFKKIMAKKQKAKKAAAKEATVYLYDEIGMFGINAEDFVKDLDAMTADTIHLRINSPGGSIFGGVAIFNAIQRHKSKIIAHVDGVAASISSVIPMAADKIVMAKNSHLMIHEAFTLTVGTSDDHREAADLLDKVSDVIIEAYKDKSGWEADDIVGLMKAVTWMSAKEATDAGFADEILNDEEAQNKSDLLLFDLSVFGNVPEALQVENSTEKPTERDLESILREAGHTRAEAKHIVAVVNREAQREAEGTEEPKPDDVAGEPPREATPASPLPTDVDSVAYLIGKSIQELGRVTQKQE